MTAKELLDDLESCTGPCGRMCLSCPESRYLAEIHEVLKGLMDENERLRGGVREIVMLLSKLKMDESDTE